MRTELETLLLFKRTQASEAQAFGSMISELGVTLISLILFWQKIPQLWLMVWAGVSVSNSIISYCWHRNMFFANEIQKYKHWQKGTIVFSFLTGGVWALLPFTLFVVDDINFLMLTIVIYCGYVSGALSVTTSNRASFLSFAIGISLPLITRLVIEGEPIHLTICALMVFYISMLFYVSSSLQVLFIDATRSELNNTKLLRQLETEKEAVEQAVASKDRFLASVSHDLRQPLNAISLFVDVLIPMQSNTAAPPILSKVKQSLKALSDMMHGLLDISKLDANAVSVTPQSFCLTTNINQILDEYREKTTHLVLNNEMTSPINVFTDPVVLNRVLRNLIDNAVKYTEQGEVTIQARQSDTHISVIIKDTGIGISKENLSIIFDEFEQLNNPERNREKGLGLGLAIVKRLCKLSDIDLEIQSKLGAGTTIRLTIEPSTENTDSISSKLIEKETASEELLKGACLAIVDDESDILFGLQQLLNQWGCSLAIGHSQDELMLDLREKKWVPDAILSDLRLKGGAQGIDLIQALHEEYNKEIPAILITGDTAPERVKEVKKTGIEVMYKPIEPDVLKRNILKLLNNA